MPVVLQPDFCPVCQTRLPLDCARPRIATLPFWVRALVLVIGIVALQVVSWALSLLLSIKPLLDWLRQNPAVGCMPMLIVMGGMLLLFCFGIKAFASKRVVKVACPTCRATETCLAMEDERFTKRLKAIQGWNILAFFAFFIICPISCAENSLRATYDRGVAFRGYHTLPIVRGFGGGEGRFQAVSWSRRNSRLPVCPIVVHLASGDIDETDFDSPALMKKLGGEVRNNFGDHFDTVLRKDGFQIVVWYDKGSLEMVEVLVPISGDPKHRVTVLGETILLPISKEGLFTALGEPLSFREVPPP